MRLLQDHPFWINFFVFIGVIGVGTLYGLSVRWGYWHYGRGRSWATVTPILLGAVVVASATVGCMLTAIGMVLARVWAEPRPVMEVLLEWLNNTGSVVLLFASWTAIYIGVMSVREYQRSQLRNLRLENALQAAQLNTLQGQLNPHFIFNGLNNIRALMLEDVDRSRHMLTVLSNLLRASLSGHKREKVTLAQEMALVDDFVELSSIQLEHRLRYERHIETGVEPLLVPPMMVQMLVENAIKHGIARYPEGGTLGIRIALEGERLCCDVRNPGVLQGGQTARGIGLRNIRERLTLLYGDRARLALQHQDGQVLARLNLPVERA